MASSKFLERFKNKSGTMDATGVPNINLNGGISKANGFEPNSVLQSSGASVVGSRSPSSDEKTPYSYQYARSPQKIGPGVGNAGDSGEGERARVRGREKEKIGESTPIFSQIKEEKKGKRQGFSRSIKGKDYKPYTIKDYAGIKSERYYQLGGLGPSYVGTNKWKLDKQRNEKRIKYGVQVYYLNAAKFPLLPLINSKQKEIEDNSRKRALEFAKSIIKPSLKVPLDTTSPRSFLN